MVALEPPPTSLFSLKIETFKKIVETLILPMSLSRMASTVCSFWDLGCFWVNQFLSNCDWEEEERRIVIINFLFHWSILKEIRSIWEVWKLFHCLISCDGGGRRESLDEEKEIRCRVAYHALLDILLIHKGWYELLIRLIRRLITNPWLSLYYCWRLECSLAGLFVCLLTQFTFLCFLRFWDQIEYLNRFCFLLFHLLSFSSWYSSLTFIEF